jgi:hypothetical protein
MSHPSAVRAAESIFFHRRISVDTICSAIIERNQPLGMMASQEQPTNKHENRGGQHEIRYSRRKIVNKKDFNQRSLLKKAIQMQAITASGEAVRHLQ